MSILNAAAGPLIGFLGGVLASLLGSYLQYKWATARDKLAWAQEREQRSEEREEVRSLRQIDFQTQNLLIAQEALNELARNVFSIHLSHQKHFQDSGEWRKKPSDIQISENCRISMLSCSTAETRIVYEPLRIIMSEIRSLATKSLTLSSQKDAESAVIKMIFDVEEANKLVGEQLRSINFN